KRLKNSKVTKLFICVALGMSGYFELKIVYICISSEVEDFFI
ncbi:MAG: hypothetical protein ACI8YW_000429, partial [Flavobacteriaceae bacterium]